MLILHISDAYPPRQGGIETQVRGLAMQQRQAGHDVGVLTCTAATASGLRAWTSGPRPRRDAPQPTGEPDVLRVGLPWLHVPASSVAVGALLRELKPDVVHAHLSVLSPLTIIGVRAAVRVGVPVVVTAHSLWWWAVSLYRMADRLTGWAGWPIRWTAVSDLAARPLRRIIGDRAEVGVLPNGIDVHAWRGGADAAHRETFSGRGELRVVSVMRLALRKRPRALLRIVRDVCARLPDDVRLRVVVVGDGSQRRAMRRHIRRYGLQDVVQLVGRQTPQGIREIYRTADVYLAPATLESFGIAALEARSAGVPVVARRRTGIADFVVDGDNGLLADDDAGLAAAVLTLAGAPALLDRMRRRSLEAPPPAAWAEVLRTCETDYGLAADIHAGAG